MRAALTLFLVTAAACDGASVSEVESKVATIEHWRFEIPLEWKRTDAKRDDVLQSVWSPLANERKESIAVVRSKRSDGGNFPGEPALGDLLRTAQNGLRQRRVSSLTPVSTAHGLVGARLDATFVPEGLSRSYRRTHVVLMDRSHPDELIHVLYTAADPDPASTALDLVLSTLTAKEG